MDCKQMRQSWDIPSNSTGKTQSRERFSMKLKLLKQLIATPFFLILIFVFVSLGQPLWSQTKKENSQKPVTKTDQQNEEKTNTEDKAKEKKKGTYK